MPDRLITHLRHVDLAVPDYASQLDFYEGVWGLEKVAGDTGLAFLAAVGSPEQFIVRLRKAQEKRIDLIAFGAANRVDVDQLTIDLGKAGVRIVSEPGDLDSVGGGYGMRFFDNEGRTVEVSAEVQDRRHRRIEVGESIPVRLSHVVLNSADPEGTVDFYERYLQFALSDTLKVPHAGEMMWFMRCNPRHHSVAFARSPHSTLHHVSFELRGVDEFMYGTGRLLREGTPLMWGPGRHLAGNNTFSYFVDPSHNIMEYTTELEVLDEDTWHPSVHDLSDAHVQDQWGTAGTVQEMLARVPASTEDPGLFVEPPV